MLPACPGAHQQECSSRDSQQSLHPFLLLVSGGLISSGWEQSEPTGDAHGTVSYLIPGAPQPLLGLGLQGVTANAAVSASASTGALFRQRYLCTRGLDWEPFPLLP